MAAFGILMLDKDKTRDGFDVSLNGIAFLVDFGKSVLQIPQVFGIAVFTITGSDT
jgi:hypothetical protein